mmetsp:Transcript_26995/g.84449  ORF Transcript_26995/g.84449 Transcript_26995/m.84449 type:complete len:199 (+) Transcript_26995:82-678(+)
MRSSLLTVAAAVSSAAHIFQRQPTIQLVNARRSAVPLPAIPQLPRLLRPPRLSAGEADDEIAALEAKLAEAKRAKEEAERARLREEAEVRRAAAELSGDLDEGFDFNTLSSRKKVAAVKAPPPPEFLSESWKEEEAGEGGGLGLVNLAGGAALVLGLIAFSQVPVGSNLDLATYGGGTVAVESPEQIRQRYGEVAGGE